MLGFLSILTLLFAVSSKRAISFQVSQNSEAALAQRAFLNQELAKLAGHQILAEDGKPSRFISLGVDGKTYEVAVIDAAGFVDLNTATPALLLALFEGVGLSSEDLDTYLDWRRTPYRLLRVNDLPRIIGTSNFDRELLLENATVFSGRTGIAARSAPDQVLEFLGLSLSDERLGSEPTQSIFHLRRIGQSGHTVPIGVLKINMSDRTSRQLLVSS